MDLLRNWRLLRFFVAEYHNNKKKLFLHFLIRSLIPATYSHVFIFVKKQGKSFSDTRLIEMDFQYIPVLGRS